MKKFNIIYADPAWSYRDKCHAGERGAGYKYPCLDTAGICALPVAELAADDCALFIWGTFPMIHDCLKVIEAWGFNYKTAAFVWEKTNKKADSDFFGMGNWTRANAEVCFIATKGKPKRVSASVRQIVRCPVMEHSRKPPEVRERIVELLGPLPRLELFAREVPPGWDAWGNEISSTICMEMADPMF
jgi:N6-adenosine-specific RNA methylase IME4